MTLAHFSMLINEIFNKHADIVPEEDGIILLDIKYDVCMDKNGKDTKHKSNISRRVNFVSNGEKCKLYKIDCCEGGLKMADIATKNIGKNDLNPVIKYIMVSLDN